MRVGSTRRWMTSRGGDQHKPGEVQGPRGGAKYLCWCSSHLCGMNEGGSGKPYRICCEKKG